MKGITQIDDNNVTVIRYRIERNKVNKILFVICANNKMTNISTQIQPA